MDSRPTFARLVLQKCHPRLVGMVAVFVTVIYGCLVSYSGITTAPSTIDVRYRFFQAAFHTGAVGIVIIALGVALAAVVLRKQPEGRRSIRLRLSDGTILEIQGIQHMRDNLDQVLTAIARKDSCITLGNDNSPMADDRKITSFGS